MKIAFIHNALTSYRVELFNKLSRLFDINYFFYDSYSETSEEIKFDYKFMKGFRFPFIDPEYKWPCLLFFDLIKGRYDVFIGAGASQIETMITFVAAKLMKKPFIIWNVLWFYNDSLLSKLRFPFFRYMVLNSDAVILPGTSSKRFHLRLGVRDDKIWISPNTARIDLGKSDLERCESLKKDLNIMDDDFLVLCFSRLSCEKGLEYLIESYQYLGNQKVKYIIATTMGYENQYFDHLNRMASRIDKDNIIITRIDETQKNPLFYLCDLFVLPSIFRRNKGPDIWGMVLNEALSMGMPLIATNMVGGAYDMIKHGRNGFIVPERDPEKIAKAVIKIKNRSNLEDMREYSLSMFSNFRIENEVQGFIDAIKRVADKVSF